MVSGGDAVIDKVEEKIDVTELDLGDCPSKMLVGTSQMLSVLVIPVGATEAEFIYQSDNPEIASVNALGRLTAHKAGGAQITVSCGSVNASFVVTVVDDDSYIPVQDIEIGDVDDTLDVDSKMNISANVLPINATHSTLNYKSSDTQIATVNSSGQIKGIAPGQVTIEISAGNVVKTVPLKVKVATSEIKLNSEYVVLKPNDTFQLEADVYPKEALSEIKYKSLNTDIAVISSNGLITAQTCGVTTIIVSNDDYQITASVIINEEEELEVTSATNSVDNQEVKKDFADKVNVEACAIVSGEMLKYFYEKEKILTIEGEGYTWYVDGKQIVNFENALMTELLFEEQEGGFSFVINDGNNLCGKIMLDIGEKITNQKYLYLYNEEKEKYEQLEVQDIAWLSIDTGGRYLLSSQKLSEWEINYQLLTMGVIAIAIGAVVYVVVKRQYWFW